MMKFFNKFKNNKGNSLAEFAVTAAMMATLATTAAPRFSGVGEAGKANQTKQNLDKIGGMVNQFYMNTSAPYSPTNRLGEGQGRVPGQTKYDVQVGGYSNLDEIMLDLTPTYADDGSIESPAIYSRWKPYGSDVEGLLSLTNKLNLELKIEKDKFNNCVQKLKSGEIDIIFGISNKNDRKNYMIFTPYYKWGSGTFSNFAISKKSKFSKLVDKFKNAKLSQEQYGQIYATNYTSSDQHDWSGEKAKKTQ